MLSIAQVLSTHINKTDQCLDTELLLAHVLQVPRTYLHAYSERLITEPQRDQFSGLLEQRRKGVPLAYLTGYREFWSLNLWVTPDVLIPRPETELLVELTLNIFSHQDTLASQRVTNHALTKSCLWITEQSDTVTMKKRLNSEKDSRKQRSGKQDSSKQDLRKKDLDDTFLVADLGTGSGAIALALAHEKPDWYIYATDNEENALHVAKTNALRLKLNNIDFRQGSWCAALPAKLFDIIVSNPPYIAENDVDLEQAVLNFEPYSALIALHQGLKELQQIIGEARAYLKQSGILLLEHGHQQGQDVRNIFINAGYSHISTYRDLAGLERVTVGHWQLDMADVLI